MTTARPARLSISASNILENGNFAQFRKQNRGIETHCRNKLCSGQVRPENKFVKEIRVMSNSKSSNQPVVPSAREALDKFKMEAASDLRVSAPS